MQLLAIAIFLLIVYLLVMCQKPRHFPPGPPRLPFVGGIPFLVLDNLGDKCKATLIRGIERMVDKYGDVCGFYRGLQQVVLVSDFHLARDLFRREEVSSRPAFRPSNESRVGHDYPELDGRIPGIIFSAGRYWRDQRRVALRSLRDFGFGKTSMESMLQEEVRRLCDHYESHVGKPYNLHLTMNASIVNALWTIMVGESLEMNNAKLGRICHVVNKAAQGDGVMSLFGTMLPFPFLAKMPFLRKWSGVEDWWKATRAVQDLIIPHVEEHLRTFDPNTMRDFMDVMLEHARVTTDPGSCFYGKHGIHSTINVCADIFMAGMETTATSLVFAFLFLLRSPDAQAKIHKELDRVVGTTAVRAPSLSDSEDMPYTNAFLHECLRRTALVTLGGPHLTTKDIQLSDRPNGRDGHAVVIPKGTIVHANLYHIMHEEKYWGDPNEFRPERFINAEGKFVADERVVPFSMGKRYCLGQSLAEKEMFLFFSGVLHRFEVRHHEAGSPLPNPDDCDSTGITRKVPFFEVILAKRLKAF